MSYVSIRLVDRETERRAIKEGGSPRAPHAVQGPVDCARVSPEGRRRIPDCECGKKCDAVYGDFPCLAHSRHESRWALSCGPASRVVQEPIPGRRDNRHLIAGTVAPGWAET